ncbi:MAG: RcnB family protein [Pseudomonadota bacterium]|nr:RcnB family protein [Pseudomonadota bacterium]
MKATRFVATAVALSIGFGNLAFAQSGPRGDASRAEQHDRGQDRNDNHDRDRAENRDQAPARRADERQDRRTDARIDRREDRHDERREDRRDDRRDAVRQEERWAAQDSRWVQRGSRGAGPRHDFYRGGRLPPYYRSHVYVVDNWRGYHLRQPPVGYHWVQTGGDYVLAAIATGVILSVILNH